MNVTVIGLGKIGVPLAVQFASKGATVTGYDIDGARVKEISAGVNPFPTEPGLEAIPGLVKSGAIRATCDAAAAARDADVLVFIVPVDIDDQRAPDFGALDAAVEAIAPHVCAGALAIVETTVPAGTTRDRVGGRIAERAGLTMGRDLFVAFSPERVSSGTVLRDLRIYPKIVGGVDGASTERAVEFYRAMLDADVMPLRDAETAEFSKLAETIFRDVNIALANELARAADRLGVDVSEAIAAANSQPYSHIHQPGVGVGGHCIPVYPYFLASEDTELLTAARRINDDMARYAVDRLSAALGGLTGKRVVVLGLSYRAGVKESRHSSAFRLVEALNAVGAETFVHDPLFTADEFRAHGLTPAPSFPLPCDALVVQAWHGEYADLDFAAFPGLRAVVDGRGAIDRAFIESRGIWYLGIGRGVPNEKRKDQ